ncbi:uncharacterized protein LOC101174619 isoform X3 [Oryzias latipes]|uniref:uncharacterized protein LOC101174619 isoform X3 n=1 Tax=Oryzias latipes TaxID=8090 RepID=UPI0009DA6171|nr:uncharacterized protein LOC101174619 isoform X3 [Oryzias latipes]
MKTVIFCLLLLPLAAVVENAPVRAQRNNVVNFLKGTFGSTTEKTTTANPPEKFKESDEILILEGAANQAVPWRRPAGQNLKLTDTSSRLIEDHDGQKQSGYQGQVQAREEQSDLSSEEEMMLDGKRVRQSTNLQRQPGNTRKNRMSGRPVPDQSQEEPDWDSFENNRGAGAAVDNSRHANCDETRECSSVETHAAIGPDRFPALPAFS